MKKLPLIQLMTIYYGETIAVDWPWHIWACLKIPDPKKSDPPKYNHFFQVAVLVFLSFILTWGRFSIAHEVVIVICCFQIDDWNHQLDFDEYSHCCFHWFPRSLTLKKNQLQSSNLRACHEQAMILRDWEWWNDGLMFFFLLVLSEFGSLRLPVGQV